MKVEYTDPTLRLATVGPLLLPCWWNAPTVPQMHVVKRIADAQEKRYAGRTAYAQFVLEGTPIFGSEVRRIAEDLTQRYFALGIAHCIELSGLAGTTTRAFLGGLALVRRTKTPMRTFAGPQETCAWLAERLAEEDEGAVTAKRILEARQALVDGH